jgi:hypothetical protein
MKTFCSVLIIVAICLAGCSREEIKGNGVIKTETRPITEFSSLVVNGGYRVKWSPGKPMFTISADDNLLPLIKTTLHGETLEIASKENLAPTKDITITVSSSGLDSIRLNGGIRFHASELARRKFKIESSGAADITIAGSVSDLEAHMMGASHLTARSLQVETANLSLLGASDAHVNVSDSLRVSILGAGSVVYSGNPKTVEQKITGTGKVQPSR